MAASSFFKGDYSKTIFSKASGLLGGYRLPFFKGGSFFTPFPFLYIICLSTLRLVLC